MEGIEAMGFEKPTPIQAETIPHSLQGKDILAVAQTGTGKTAAFLLPVMNLVEKKQSSAVNAIVVTPTRELAMQIDQQCEGFSYFTHANSYAIYGGGTGSSFDQEKRALTQGTNIIIATPGRLMSHLNLGYIDFSDFDFLILDEADRMLDMGFYEDIIRIINKLPEKRQTLMFSATMPDRIRDLTSRILKDPVQVNIAISKPAAGITQGAYLVYDKQKVELVKHLLKDKEDLTSIIIFSSTKNNVKTISSVLRKQGMNAGAIHSDLNQQEREDVLLAFKTRRLRILVATDIVARGIDIEGINLVINYEAPGDAEDYVHRIGRTARADNTGMGITFINDQDQHKFAKIEHLIEREVDKLPLPEHLGEGPVYNPKRRGGGKGRSGGKKRHFKKKPYGNRKGGGGQGKKDGSGGQSGNAPQNASASGQKKSGNKKHWYKKKKSSGGNKPQGSQPNKPAPQD